MPYSCLHPESSLAGSYTGLLHGVIIVIILNVQLLVSGKQFIFDVVDHFWILETFQPLFEKIL